MEEIPYKGYLIHPTPQQLTTSREWTIALYIQKHRGDIVAEKPFNNDKTFKTEKEAIQHCIDYGKQIIDGKYDNCTVADL